MEEANKLIGAGKKHLVMGNAVEAASVLQEACGMLAKTFGDTADECGEAFLWCGRALLDLARMENTVLGNALEGVPEEETEEGEKNKDSNVESPENVDEKTRDELRAKVYDAMSEEKINGEKEKDGKKTEDEEKKAEGEKGDEGEKEGKNEQKSTPKKEGDGGVKGASPSGGDVKEDIEKVKEERAEKMEEGDSEEEEEADDDNDDDAKGDGDDEAKGSGDEDDEEVGNLQLAWEMLEVAKVIYKRKDTKDAQLLAAQAHLKLGEVSSESGNYSQALEDLQECLRLRQKHLEPDSRLLAETHYQLGLTHTLHCQYSLAIQQLQNAAAVITTRMDNLQAALAGASAEEEEKEEVSEERKELEELGELLPELKEKVEDAEEGLKAALAEQDGVSSSAFSAPRVQDGGASSSTPTVTAKPTNGVSSTNGHASKASDISHLVRKRKPEESPVEGGSTKRLKPEEKGPQHAAGEIPSQ